MMNKKKVGKLVKKKNILKNVKKSRFRVDKKA